MTSEKLTDAGSGALATGPDGLPVVAPDGEVRYVLRDADNAPLYTVPASEAHVIDVDGYTNGLTLTPDDGRMVLRFARAAQLYPLLVALGDALHGTRLPFTHPDHTGPVAAADLLLELRSHGWVPPDEREGLT